MHFLLQVLSDLSFAFIGASYRVQSVCRHIVVSFLLRVAQSGSVDRVSLLLVCLEKVKSVVRFLLEVFAIATERVTLVFAPVVAFHDVPVYLFDA